MSIGGISNTGTFPKLLWPGVKALWGRMYNQKEPQYTKLVYSEGSKKNYEEIVKITPYGLAPQKPEGQPGSYDGEVQGYTTRFTHITYALGFKVTWEEMEDNLYDQVAKTRTTSLVRSQEQTRENVVANIFNRAFNSSYLGGDGVSLCNTAHPNTTGGTFANTPTVAAQLSEAAIEDMLIMIMNAVDDRGLKIALKPKSLHVSNYQIFNAEKILGSVFQPGTGNNTINVIYANKLIPEGVFANTYFSSQNAWFIRTDIADGTGLIMFDRYPVTLSNDNDFDTKNFRAMSITRFSAGWADPLCLYGNNAL